MLIKNRLYYFVRCVIVISMLMYLLRLRNFSHNSNFGSTVLSGRRSVSQSITMLITKLLRVLFLKLVNIKALGLFSFYFLAHSSSVFSVDTINDDQSQCETKKKCQEKERERENEMNKKRYNNMKTLNKSFTKLHEMSY